MSYPTINQVFSGVAEFVAGTDTIARIPKESLPEIAFIGKSNVGKSTLINSICNRKTLARVSNTPGRTQQINFFSIHNCFMLVDLPGYGYAKIPPTMHAKWETLITHYLSKRDSLKLVCVLIDARRGIQKNDVAVLRLLEDFNKYYWIIFTKSDKIHSRNKLAEEVDIANKLIASLQLSRQNNIADRSHQFPDRLFKHGSVFCTNSRGIEGVRQLKTNLWEFLSRGCT